VIFNRFGDPRLAGLTSPNLCFITNHFRRDPETIVGPEVTPNSIIGDTSLPIRSGLCRWCSPDGETIDLMTRGADGIDPEEILLVGGSWEGLLFENPSTGLPLLLSWTFTFEFADVARGFGTSPLSLTVDWVRLGGSTWEAMVGQSASGSSFGDPIEASVYFFEHHRFDAAEVEVTAQDGDRLYVMASVRGDIDGLGWTRSPPRDGSRSRG
jgi:hypothetical protein